MDWLPTVRGDARQLSQLLQNLVSNGVKFAREDRPPVVHVHAERRIGDGVISVVDNGIGLGAEDRERAFRMFTRLHHTADGTGIGLAICQRIVERHGGEIWIDDGADGGSAFRFSLPDAHPSGG